MHCDEQRQLILPDLVTIALRDGSDRPIKVPNVVFSVHLFARRKNDFELLPFSSDADGRVTITRRDLECEIASAYDSGLMDYVAVESCFPLVELRLLSAQQIDQALAARIKGWRSLLKGEADRWASIDDLLRVYRNARNKDFVVYEGYSRVRDEWDGRQRDYHYAYSVGVK